MRYKIRYNSRNARFLVFDTQGADTLIGTFASLEGAHRRARSEEAGRHWFVALPDGGGSWPKDLAAV